MIPVSKRLEGIGEYYFSQKLAEIAEMNKQGEPVINLGIGSPDLPPHPEVIQVLQQEAAKPNTHGYQSYKGAEALRKAAADWYQRWYGVELNPATEILPLIGSKEGIMHICMTYLNEGDIALIPNPGYPTYSSAVKLAGGKAVAYDLKEENNWLIDFDALEKTIMAPSGSPDRGESQTHGQLNQESFEGNKDGQISEVLSDGNSPSIGGGRGEAGAVKLMFVNYPQMPTGQLPSKEFFEQLVAFGKQHNILIIHDNPYSFILNDKPMSLLSVKGAKDIVLELNSLSKSQNMAGWRVGVLCGAKERINEVLVFKSNMDSGMFLPLQLAAAKALSLDQQWYDGVNAVYRKRRIKAYELLDLLDCSYSADQVGMFVWAKVPAKYKTGYEVSDDVLYKARVFITPGGIFGSAGDGYIRVSLCATEEKFEEAIQKIKNNLK